MMFFNQTVYINAFLNNYFGIALIGTILYLLFVNFLSNKKIASIQVLIDFNEQPNVSGNVDIQDPSLPGYIKCFNPCTSGYLGKVPIMTPEQVEASVLRARAAQEEWKKTSFNDRRRVLQIMQKFIVDHQREICRVAKLDSGKTNIDALLGEVLTTCEKISYVCKHGESALQREHRPTSILTLHKKAYVEYLPLGVLGVISPWNYPFHNVMNHVISGIFAGNAVVCKLSEHTSWSGKYVGEIISRSLEAAGYSADLVQIITGLGETGQALVASPGVDKIIFTGSTAVGKKVMKAAAENVKPVILELGGKDPMILCEDINVETVLPIALRGVYQNCGQNCCGVERIYAYDAIHDEFVDKALQMVKNFTQGDDSANGDCVDCGAMVTPAQLEIIESLIDDAVRKGANILIGGERDKSSNNGFYFKPTILVNVTHSMRISQEEVFGPVMTIFRVVDDEHLLSIVNQCPFGLGSSIFSKSDARAVCLGRKIRTGMATINDFGTNYLVQSLPFGGTKFSGFGRFAGPEGLRNCCLQRSVVEDKFPFVRTTIPKVLQYPISPSSMDFGTNLIAMCYADNILERMRALLNLIKASTSRK